MEVYFAVRGKGVSEPLSRLGLLQPLILTICDIEPLELVARRFYKLVFSVKCARNIRLINRYFGLSVLVDMVNIKAV